MGCSTGLFWLGTVVLRFPISFVWVAGFEGLRLGGFGDLHQGLVKGSRADAFAEVPDALKIGCRVFSAVLDPCPEP